MPVSVAMIAASHETVRVSVVAPCFDEAEGIESVVRAWDRLLAEQPFSSEIVLCDDGSTDATPTILARLQRELPRLVVISLRPNGGYGRALSAAIAASRGEVVVTLDSDGQFDLADGLILVRRLEAEGLDCVTGYRRAKADSAVRVAADRGLNQLVRRLFGICLLYTSDAADEL